MLQAIFLFSQDGVAFKVDISIFVSAGDDVIDLFNQRGVSFSELDFEFVDFGSHLEFYFSFLKDIMVDGDDLDLFLEVGELLDFVFDLLFECELN
jgi:hypothetical protein